MSCQPATHGTGGQGFLAGSDFSRLWIHAGWVSILAAVGIIFLICAAVLATKAYRGSPVGPFGITLPGMPLSLLPNCCTAKRVRSTTSSTFV